MEKYRRPTPLDSRQPPFSDTAAPPLPGVADRAPAFDNTRVIKEMLVKPDDDSGAEPLPPEVAEVVQELVEDVDDLIEAGDISGLQKVLKALAVLTRRLRDALPGLRTKETASVAAPKIEVVPGEHMLEQSRSLMVKFEKEPGVDEMRRAVVNLIRKLPKIQNKLGGKKSTVMMSLMKKSEFGNPYTKERAISDVKVTRDLIAEIDPESTDPGNVPLYEQLNRFLDALGTMMGIDEAPKMEIIATEAPKLNVAGLMDMGMSLEEVIQAQRETTERHGAQLARQRSAQITDAQRHEMALDRLNEQDFANPEQEQQPPMAAAAK